VRSRRVPLEVDEFRRRWPGGFNVGNACGSTDWFIRGSEYVW